VDKDANAMAEDKRNCVRDFAWVGSCISHAWVLEKEMSDDTAHTERHDIAGDDSGDRH
jgi:hypothetical protein